MSERTPRLWPVAVSAVGTLGSFHIHRLLLLVVSISWVAVLLEVNRVLPSADQTWRNERRNTWETFIWCSPGCLPLGELHQEPGTSVLRPVPDVGRVYEHHWSVTSSKHTCSTLSHRDTTFWAWTEGWIRNCFLTQRLWSFVTSCPRVGRLPALVFPPRVPPRWSRQTHRWGRLCWIQELQERPGSHIYINPHHVVLRDTNTVAPKSCDRNKNTKYECEYRWGDWLSGCLKQSEKPHSYCNAILYLPVALHSHACFFSSLASAPRYAPLVPPQLKSSWASWLRFVCCCSLLLVDLKAEIM